MKSGASSFLPSPLPSIHKNVATLQSPRYLPWKNNLSHDDLPIPIDTKTGDEVLLARIYLEEEHRYTPGNDRMRSVAIATVFEWGYEQLEKTFEYGKEPSETMMEGAFLGSGWPTDGSLKALKAYFYAATPTERFEIEWNQDMASHWELLEEAAAYLLWMGQMIDGDAPSFSFRYPEIRDVGRDAQLREYLLEGGESRRRHILNRWADRKGFMAVPEDTDDYHLNGWTVDSEDYGNPTPSRTKQSQRFWKAREGVYLDGVNPGPDRSQNYSYWEKAGEFGREDLIGAIWEPRWFIPNGLSPTQDDDLRWVLEPEMEEVADGQFVFAFSERNKFRRKNKVRNWLMYAFFRDVGLFPSQVLKLRVSDINFETCTVPAIHKQSRKENHIPLPDHVVDGLRAYLYGSWEMVRVGGEEDGPLFTVQSGGPVAQAYLHTFLQNTGEEEIGQRVVPSTLRDTWRGDQFRDHSDVSLRLN